MGMEKRRNSSGYTKNRMQPNDALVVGMLFSSLEEDKLDLKQAASRLAKSLQAKLFSRLAWLVWFFGLEKAWLARPKLVLVAS